MTTLLSPIDPQTLKNFESIIDGSLFKTEDTSNSFFNQRSFYMVVTVVTGIALAVFYDNWSVKAVAGFISLGVLVHYLKTPSENKIHIPTKPDIESVINGVSNAIAIERRIRNESFNKSFEVLSKTSPENWSEIMNVYNNFYASGNVEELNSFLKTKNISIEISSKPTIHMENYRNLFPLVNRFLKMDLHTLYKNAPSTYKKAIPMLESTCLLFLPT